MCALMITVTELIRQPRSGLRNRLLTVLHNRRFEIGAFVSLMLAVVAITANTDPSATWNTLASTYSIIIQTAALIALLLAISAVSQLSATAAGLATHRPNGLQQMFTIICIYYGAATSLAIRKGWAHYFQAVVLSVTLPPIGYLTAVNYYELWYPRAAGRGPLR